MVSLSQVRILAANVGHPVCKFGPNKATPQGQHATNKPCTNNQSGSVNLLCDDVSINEDAGAHDSAHNHHRGVKETDSAYQFGSGHVVWVGEDGDDNTMSAAQLLKGKTLAKHCRP
jgi:hypothetical protein